VLDHEDPMTLEITQQSLSLYETPSTTSTRLPSPKPGRSGKASGRATPSRMDAEQQN